MNAIQYYIPFWGMFKMLTVKELPFKVSGLDYLLTSIIQGVSMSIVLLIFLLK